MLLVKEVTTSTYRYDADGNMLHKFIEEIRQYHYKNEKLLPRLILKINLLSIWTKMPRPMNMLRRSLMSF